MREINENIFEEQFGKKKIILTLNQVKGVSVYDERLNFIDGKEYREWDPSSSKISAGFKKGLKDIYLKKNNAILYLGASTGTTVSHISDILTNGFIFAVESAPRVCRELLFLAEQRKNIAPILADANHPELYEKRITKVDWLYQDVSQKNQLEIFFKNLRLFLKPKGYALLALKAKNIDITKKPREIFEKVEKELNKELEILAKIELEPYQKDHCLFVCQIEKDKSNT